MRSSLATQDLYNIFFKMCFDFKAQNYQQTSSITYQLVFTHEPFLWLSKSSSCYFNSSLVFDLYSFKLDHQLLNPNMSFVFNNSFWYIYIMWFLCPLQVKRPTKYYFQYLHFFAILTNNCITLLIINISEIVKKKSQKTIWRLHDK